MIGSTERAIRPWAVRLCPQPQPSQLHLAILSCPGSRDDFVQQLAGLFVMLPTEQIRL
jgi:hypothetical protein